MPRKNPPLIVVGGLSNRIYCVTRYTKGTDGMITAHEKFDVTDQVGAALEELDKRGLELKPVRSEEDLAADEIEREARAAGYDGPK